MASVNKLNSIDNMSSKIVKVATNDHRNIVDLKRKKVNQPNARVVSSTNKSLSLRSPVSKLGKRKRANESKDKCSSCSRRTFLKNYSNFMKSGLPQRLLFSQDGQWVDFSQEVLSIVKEGFRSKRAAIEVDCHGCHFMLDILYMIQVDLKTGTQKPIAWIDDAGNCVFPEIYSSCHGNHEDLDLVESSNTPEINVLLEIELNGLDNNKGEECVGESDVKRVKAEQELPNNNCALVEEKEGDEHVSPDSGTSCGTVDVETAKNMFIASLGLDLKFDSLEVKKCSSSLMEARFELFQKQVELTQKLRGKANVQYGWFAAVGGAQSGVMFYGHNGPKLGRYGYGIHLAAHRSAPLSTMVCDDDENGLKHMVLCRVILGNVEVVHAGSKQFYPSDLHFDSGVDDLQNPNSYVIWNTNMNTHIFPECVVSFKMSSTIKGNLVGEESRPRNSIGTTTYYPSGPLNQDSSSIQTGKNDSQPEVINLPSHEKVPIVGSSTPMDTNTPGIHFSMLFEAISAKVAPNVMKSLLILHQSFRANKIKREEFFKKMRSVVGDQILRSTISILQSKKSFNSASISDAKEAQKG